MKPIVTKGFLISLIESPREKIAINSLSLSNFIKASIRPKIIINGSKMFIKFGIRNNDKKKMLIKST